MRNYVLGIIAILMCVSCTHAVFYDDLGARDISDSDSIVISGTNDPLPSSKPLILGSDLSETMMTTGVLLSSGIVSSTTLLSGVDIALLANDIELPGSIAINQLPELERDAEFLMSLRWLYEQGLTKFEDPEAYMPDNYLSRVDAAKMLSVLSRKVFGLTTINNDVCDYNDVQSYDEVTKSQVKEACKLGIFRSASIFNPNQGITKGQVMAVLIRMYQGKKLDETPTPWYKNYIQQAREIGLLPDRSEAGMDETMSRLDVAKILYKLRNIYLNKSPTTKTQNPLFIKILDNGSGASYQALINVDMVRDDAVQTLEMKLDTVTYYFSKSKIYNYGTTLSSFQVYGYIYASSESITPIGVGSWRVQKGVVQEGSIIIWGKPQTVYSIYPSQDATVYTITKKE